MILAIGTICFGRDRLSKEYMVAGIRMGEQLGLIGEQRKDARQYNTLSHEMRSMLTFVGWGAFNLSTSVEKLNIRHHVLTGLVFLLCTSMTSTQEHSQSVRRSSRWLR